MVPELAALKLAAVTLLRAREQHELARHVEEAETQLWHEPQTWLLGSREVTAHVLALVLPVEGFVALTRSADALAAVRDAFADAMRSPSMALAELVPVLRLPVVDRPWQLAYRAVPVSTTPERPAPEAVLAGAAALLTALGRRDGAAIVRRATLESADLPTSGDRALVRWVVRLETEDLVAARRDSSLGEAIRDAITDAATRAMEAVADVELRLKT